jgi:hypothetical protein
MVGYVLDCHHAAQLHCVTLKAFGVCAALFGKTDLSLANDPTVFAFDPLDRQNDADRTVANGKGLEVPCAFPTPDNVRRTAVRALQLAKFLLNGEDDLTAKVLRANMAVAPQTESMVQ